MLRRTLATFSLAALTAIGITSCGEDAQKNYGSMKDVFSDAKSGSYEDAICGASSLYVDMDEGSQEKTRWIGKKIVDMARGTDWADSHASYIDLGEKVFGAVSAGNEARTESLRASIDDIC